MDPAFAGGRWLKSSHAETMSKTARSKFHVCPYNIIAGLYHCSPWGIVPCENVKLGVTMRVTSLDTSA
jgi:hypothetical protein